MDDERIANTLRRCRGQYCRPPGVTTADVQAAEERGLLRFNEWPSGHFHVTDAGREFLADHQFV